MAHLIRHMSTSDIDKVYAIERDVHIAPWSKNILRDCVLVGYDCRVLEITIDDNPVIGGYIICRHSYDHCHILNFCIAKVFQSKGYGRQLLEYMLHTLSQFEHIKYTFLEVRPSNSVALHLYEGLGFEQAEIKTAYYKDDKSVEDAILLKKILHA